MDGKEIQSALRNLGLRIEDPMANYIARQLKSGTKNIPIFGGDARTGIAIHKTLTPAEIQAAASMST